MKKGNGKTEYMKNDSLSIYIHIPFCIRKCAYCDFLSAPALPEVQEQYLHRLMEEIALKAQYFKERYTVQTVFIGGGTPTCVDAALLCDVLDLVKRQFPMAADAEISIECNPGTADAKKLSAYRKAGVNRLSIGLQSTQDLLLKKLGRIHDYAQFLDTYYSARKAGFTNINIDLMSALPGQSYADYRETLERVLALRPEHISAYSLIVEEGTPFWNMELDLPDEDTERAMYELTGAMLKSHGYDRYEISNYARAGYACKHNLVYWERGEYLGLGLGAASFLRTVPDEKGQTFTENKERENKDGTAARMHSGQAEGQKLEYGIRLKNQSSLSAYLQGDFSYEEISPLTKRDAMEEFFFLGLRKMQGVSLKDFASQFGGEALQAFEKPIAQNIKDGLLMQKKDRLMLTARGIDVSNFAFARFLED